MREPWRGWIERSMRPASISPPPAALFVVFDDDRIAETRQYFDMVGLYEQIGALP